jgi:DNA-binding winged helix-turn-helix (wHTH) protein/tetratricopeptide (TPR) repeat protein
MVAGMLHRFGPFELDERRFELRRNGKPLALQRRVLETIAYFVKNPDRLISKDELIAGPWKGTAVGDAALAHAIMVARKALTERGNKRHLIETVRGKGYRFVADVTTETADGSPINRPREFSGPGTKTPASNAEPSPSNHRFLGREAEMKVLLSAADRAVVGHGNLVLLGGEPGIGKTSLLERFARAVSGLDVLWGRCWEGGGAPAFWPWLEIVRGYVDAYENEAIGLMGAGAADIAQLLPELRPRLSGVSGVPPDPTSPQARFRIFDSVTRFLIRAANTRALAIIVEDLHAADDASVMLLEFICRALDGTRLLLIASFRDLELRKRPALSARLNGPLAPAVPVKLKGLTESQVAQLLRSTVGQLASPDLVRRVHQSTNGNPFLVGQVAQTVLADMADGQKNSWTPGSFRFPNRVAEIVQQHLRHLPAPTIAALSAASVIGRQFDLPLLRELCGMGPERGIGDLEPALLEGVVRESVGGAGVYSFSHTLIREALYSQLPPSRRLDLHYSAAELLERKQVADYAAAFQIAHHYFSAAAHKGADKALHWELRAGEKARDIFAYEQAAEHYRRALQLLDLVGRSEDRFCEILLLLADTQRLLGQMRESTATFQQVEDVARSSGLDIIGGRALLGSADVLRDALPLDGTMHRRIEQALERIPTSDSAVRASLLAALSMASVLTKPLEERLVLCEEAIAMARRLAEPNTLTAVMYWCAFNYSQSSQIDRSLELTTEMVGFAREANNTERLLDARLYRAGHLLTKGRRQEAETELQEHARLAGDLRHPLHLWWTRVAASTVHLFAGEVDEAEALAREALALGQPLQGIAAESLFGAHLLAIASEYDGAKRLRNMEEVVRIGLKMRQAMPAFRPWVAALALAQLESGPSSEARLTFDQIANDGFDKVPDDYHRLPVMVILARIACVLEDAPRARALYAQLKPHAGTHVVLSVVGGYWGPVSHHLGTLALTMQDRLLAQSHFRAAMTESDSFKSPSWKGWAEFELGALLSLQKRQRESDGALNLLRGALSTAKALNLEKLENLAKKALRDRR